jgi:hypothetical protein
MNNVPNDVPNGMVVDMVDEDDIPPNVYVDQFGGRSGEIIIVIPGHGNSKYHEYKNELDGNDNSWAPFTLWIDWEVAQWAKLCGPGSTAFSELLAIPEVSDRDV